MNSLFRPIRVLLETHSSLTVLENTFYSKSVRQFFHLTTVSTLAEAMHEINKAAPDVIFLNADPDDNPHMSSFTRLRKHAPQVPLVAVLSDHHQDLAPAALQAGAQASLLESQISESTLPSFLFRVIERHALQKALHESGERFRMMIEHTSDLIFIMNDAGLIEYASPSAERLFYHRQPTLVGRNALDLLHRDDRKNFFDHLEQAFHSERATPFVQFRIRGNDKEWIHMEGKSRIASDGTGNRTCIMNCRDVSHRVKLENELRFLSLRDQLTGLPNRRAFVTCLEHPLKLALRSKSKGLYLLFIDLDGFKAINDYFGHKEGDRVLVEAAKILKTTFRDADVIARLGGDEFVVFLAENEHVIQIDALKRRLTEAVDAWNNVKSRSYKLAMSVGVVEFDARKHRSVELMLRHADEMMYKHKRERKRLLHTNNETPPQAVSSRA